MFELCSSVSIEFDLVGFVSELLLEIAMMPFPVESEPVHLAPSIQYASIIEQSKTFSLDLTNGIQYVHVDPIPETEIARNMYRNDMATAAELLADMAQGRVSFALQPVIIRIQENKTLYKECLL